MTENNQRKPSFKHTGLKSPITEFALALLAVKDGDWYPSGTAVIIGQNLAMTAKHVVEDYSKRFDPEIPLSIPTGEDRSFENTFSLFACQVLNNGEVAVLWSVRRFWLSHTDIAFLLLEPWSQQAQEYRWRIPLLDLISPRKGSRVFAFGYHTPSIKVNETEDRVEVEWHDSPTTSAGEIIEVYQEKRDSFMLPFPCFQVNTRSKPGMSGGPVFDESGALCGIISSSMEAPEEDGDHIYYAASLWPSMATHIDVDRKGFPAGVSYPVLDLARYGFIDAKHHERVFIRESSSLIELRAFPS